MLQCPALALLSSCKLSKVSKDLLACTMPPAVTFTPHIRDYDMLSTCVQEDKTIVRLFLHIMAKRELEIINGLSTSCWTPTFDDFLCLVSNTPSIESSPDRYKSDM